MRIKYILFLFIIVSNLCSAQSKLYDWKGYFSFRYCFDIAIAPNTIYGCSDIGLIIYDIDDNSISSKTKIDGLCNIDISAIKYSNESDALVIGYKNGNIDILRKDKVTNISDLYRKSGISNKQINSIFIYNKMAYLSCGFGVLVINIEKNEVADTYLIGDNGGYLNVNDITIQNNTFYAATSDGIRSASIDSYNLADFNNWQKDTNIPNSDSEFDCITSFNNQLFVNMNSLSDIVYKQDNNTWSELLSHSEVTAINTDNNSLVITTSDKIYQYNSTSLVKEITTYNNDSFFPVSAKIESSTLWIADREQGIVKLEDNTAQGYQPSGPISNSVWDIDIKNDKVYVVPGSLSRLWNNNGVPASMSYYDNGKWHNYNFPETDCNSVKVHPVNDNIVYISRYRWGIIELDTETDDYNVFDDTNSTLETILSNWKSCRVNGLTFDKNNNLWMANMEVNNPFHVYTNTKEWYGFDHVLSQGLVKDDYYGDIIFDEYNQKWTFVKEGKLIAFDDNNTFDSTADDIVKRFSVHVINSKGAVEQVGNQIYSIAIDNEGYMWVGTNDGPVVYYNTYSVLKSDEYYATRITKPNGIDGNASYLLDGETITAIAIDGGNRKWFGTAGSGVYLISADGQDEIHHFTSKNSPLVSDYINDIKINENNGEVFFGTGMGLVSFISDAVDGGDIFEDVYAYPNPVRPNYQGPIAIKGLVDDCIVKITDVSGNLVFETESLGGQAIWDGKTVNGVRVASGIYLAFCSNQEGTESTITKIMVVN